MRKDAPAGYRPQPMTVKASRRRDRAGRGSRRKMPVRTMSAAWKDTLAPWVLRVGTATSRCAASQPGRGPAGQRRTGRSASAGPGTPAPRIPVLTSRRPVAGTRPAVPVRHRGVPRPSRSPRRAGCRPGTAAGRRRPCHPAAAPRRPRHRRPAAGRPRAARGHRWPCHLAAAPGHPPRCRPAAGRQVRTPPGPGPVPPLAVRRRAAPSAPVTVLPGRHPRQRAPPGALHRAGAHRGGGGRSGVTPPCRGSRARCTRPASSPPGTGCLSVPHGSA